jgi:hypothetical protein
MARERNHGETLKELRASGARRLPQKKRMALPHVVEEFLSLTLSRPENYESLSARKRHEIDGEMVGFCKAQEKLREFIAVAGTDAISDLADVRDSRQIRPKMIGEFRAWMV